MQESFSFSPKNRIASSADRRMLNPSCTRRRSSPRINLTLSGAHYDACGLFRIASSKAVLKHGGPVVAGMPSSM